MNNAIVLRNFSDQIEIPPDAQARKTEALEKAAPITSVGSPEEMQVAVNVMRSLKGVTSYAEASRVEVKKPVLELGRKIDAVAGQFVSEVNSEYSRLQGLTDAYSREQARIAEEQRQAAEREREVERQRIAREQRLAAEAEERRLAQIRKAQQDARNAEIQAQWAAGAPEREKARQEAEQAELRRQYAQQRMNEERAANLALQQKAIEAAKPVVVEAPKTAGRVEKKVWKFRVLNIHELARTRPDLVTIEAKTREIQKEMALGISTTFPGLETWQETESHVRQ